VYYTEGTCPRSSDTPGVKCLTLETPPDMNPTKTDTTPDVSITLLVTAAIIPPGLYAT